ncbi:MAG TPA: redox-sensitive transcriptional activator SoxR [Angustibacter sp.]|nr:redox-sensitive transcriptional activator SoxR [Angustibacter sp.]
MSDDSGRRRASDELSIGEVARRSGLAPSAIRYYESLGLVTSTRTAGDRRRYRRAVLRRLAVIRSAQHVGLGLDEIAEAFAGIPVDRAPTKAQWARLSASWRPRLDERIRALEAVRDQLASCIGCGCLSMQQCALYNPQDTLRDSGSGPRRLLPPLGG